MKNSNKPQLISLNTKKTVSSKEYQKLLEYTNKLEEKQKKNKNAAVQDTLHQALKESSKKLISCMKVLSKQSKVCMIL